MRLPRFRLRTLMIAVAAAAVFLGGILESRRLLRVRSQYLNLASGFRTQEALSLEQARILEAASALAAKNSAFREEAARCRAEAVEERRMWQKYEYAAAHPWLPVPPDPPEPK